MKTLVIIILCAMAYLVLASAAGKFLRGNLKHYPEERSEDNAAN